MLQVISLIFHCIFNPNNQRQNIALEQGLESTLWVFLELVRVLEFRYSQNSIQKLFKGYVLNHVVIGVAFLRDYYGNGILGHSVTVENICISYHFYKVCVGDKGLSTID
jgi:hypothetical protein